VNALYLPEANRRPAATLGGGQQFGRAVHDQAGVLSDGRSAKRWVDAETFCAGSCLLCI